MASPWQLIDMIVYIVCLFVDGNRKLISHVTLSTIAVIALISSLSPVFPSHDCLVVRSRDCRVKSMACDTVKLQRSAAQVLIHITVLHRGFTVILYCRLAP